MIAQALYIAFCLAGMFAVIFVQCQHRVRGIRWWVYNVLAFALAWEAIDAWQYAPPGFPASRWLLVPSLSVALTWTAIAGRRHPEAAPPRA